MTQFRGPSVPIIGQKKLTWEQLPLVSLAEEKEFVKLLKYLLTQAPPDHVTPMPLGDVARTIRTIESFRVLLEQFSMLYPLDVGEPEAVTAFRSAVADVLGSAAPTPPTVLTPGA